MILYFVKKVMDKKSIMIVEDEGIIALDIKRRLEALGYSVTTVVDSGERAIEEVLKHMPDLILMDIVLKGKINGVEASLSIREFSEVPVIYITSYLDDEYVHQCNCSNMKYDFLIKPFNYDELTYKVERALLR
jgi:CheY-like chemotaxis protein